MLLFVEEQSESLETVDLWAYYLSLHADNCSDLSLMSSPKLKMDFKK